MEFDYVAPPKVRISAVIAKAAEIMNVDPAGLQLKSRSAELFQSRALIAWTLRRYRPNLSYQQIGNHLGGRDTSTIRSSVVAAKRLASADPYFRGAMAEMVAFFEAGAA